MQSRTSQPATLLIVGEDRDLVDLLSLSLRVTGLDTHTAYDARSAIRRFDSVEPHLVIWDLSAAADSGASPVSPKARDTIPLIVLVPDDTTCATLSKLGADDYLIKPISIQVLEARIRVYLALS